MVALTIPRGSSSLHTTCQLIFLFFLFSTLLTIAYANDTNTNTNNNNKYRAILIPRQEDPGWVEGDGDEGDATATDNYEDPSTETYQATDTYDDGSVATTTDNWQDPTTTDAWQNPTTTDDWQDPTTTDDWQDPTTTDDWQDPTTTDDWQDPTTTDEWQDPTTTDEWQDPTTTDEWQDPTTTDEWQDPTTTDEWQDSTAESSWGDTSTESSSDQTSSEYAEPSSTEAAAIPITTTTTTAMSTTEQQETTSVPETTDVTQSSSVDEQPTTTTTTTRSFSVTSSTATPSLVLGSKECADDPIVVNGNCPNDHFCNAATKKCDTLSDNGGQCYEDFQCKSGYCNNGSCGDEPVGERSNLSGGEIAGITVGSVAGAVLLVGALMWCQKRRSRQVSTRARKFEQIRTEDEDLEAVGVMRDTGNRASKYNLLTSLMTGTAVGRSLSRMGGGNNGASRSMNSQAYLSHSPQPAISERSLPYSSASGNGMGTIGAAAVGGAALAGAAHTDNSRQPKIGQPIDPSIYEDQQYYGNLAVGPSSSTRGSGGNHDYNNRQALEQTQQQLQEQLLQNDEPYRMSQASAIDPFGAATAYNNATRPSSSVERPATTVLRESTFNNLHAPIFHVSAPQDDKTVPAGGGAYVPQIAPGVNEQPQQSTEMDAFGGGKRGSWLLKEIAARWQQGSATGARASGVTATTDASSVNNDAVNNNNNNTDNSNLNVNPTKQPSPVENNNMDGGLWDDGLVSAGASSVGYSASTASTNPFRSSLSNPRDSVISALRIPPIQEDAWTSEDHVSLPNDDNRTITKGNINNDTSTQ